jgi:O-antigen/teichoic acid export membrane protein
MQNSSDEQMTETSNSRAGGAVLEGMAGISNAAELKKKSVRGGAAVVMSQGVSMGLQIITTLVLARLLSPTDYGLQAMVLTLTAFFSLFRDAGLSVASVQRETLEHDQISTLFWINVGLGVFLTIVVAAAAPFLAHFYKDPRLLWITVASASIFFINSVAIQHRALLDRAMRFTTSMKIDIVAATIGTVVAIGMAVLGFGYWALIAQNIVVPLVGTLAVWMVMPWLPGKPKWTLELRSMVRFGGTVTLNSFVVYLAYNTEKILLGRYWGAAPLGLYGRAYQLTNMPLQQLTQSVGAVAFPMLSRLQRDALRLRRSYLKAHSLIVSMTVPVVMCSSLFADEIIETMLGPKWNGAAPILRLLAPAMLVFALINPFSWLLRATGLVERSLKIALFICPVMILGVLAGLRHGPTGVALGYSSALVLMMVPLVAWAKHGTGISAGDYWDCVRRPLTAGVLGGAAGWAFKIAFQGSLPTLPLLFAEISISLGLYALLLLFAMGQREMYVDLLRQIFQKSKSGPAES